MVSRAKNKQRKENIRKMEAMRSHCPKERGPSKEALRKMAEEAIKTGRVAAPTPKPSP